MKGAWALLIACAAAGCSSIPTPRQPPARVGERSGRRLALAPVSVRLAGDEAPKGYQPEEFIEPGAIEAELARWLEAQPGVGAVRQLPAGADPLDAAWSHGDELLVEVALEDLRCRFEGHNGWWIPNVLNYLAWVFPAWFVATEVYELSFVGDVVVRSVDSSRVLERGRVAVSTEGTLDEFDRGWQLLGPIFPDNDAENWRQIARLLAPAAFAELGDQVSRRVAGDVIPTLDAQPGNLTKTLALVIGISHYADPHTLPVLPCAASDAQSVFAALTASGPALPARQVTLLLNGDADRAQVEAALAELRERAHPGDQVVVYFAGYGTRDADGLPALALHDQGPDGRPALLGLRALRAALPAQARCALWVDAGFDGQSRSLASGAPAGTDDGGLLLCATQPDAPLRVPAHLAAGLFSYHLRRGLAGAGDLDADGRLSLAELARYCEERVVAASAFFGQAQRPCLQGAGEDFVLTLTQHPGRNP